MKKTTLSLFSIFVFLMLLNSCSTDVDLYADYKDITVVYGLLDCGQDTNYIKINKAFLGPGSALDIALIADSSNYPGKLDAKLIEYRASASGTHYQAFRTLPLDTMTIHTKEPGYFYAPDQLVYYTAEKINNNDDHFKYKYELQIDRGDTILTAETDIVGGTNFMIGSTPQDFESEKGKIRWFPCPNAVVYDVRLKFYFTEIGPGGKTEDRCMSWPLGTYSLSSPSLEEDHGNYFINYTPTMFYSNLASFLGNDTLPNAAVERVVSDFCIGISISAGGEELYTYMTVNGPSSSIVQSIPEYTNIKGGYGIFSSRASKEQMVRMKSIPELIAHENWGFRQGK